MQAEVHWLRLPRGVLKVWQACHWYPLLVIKWKPCVASHVMKWNWAMGCIWCFSHLFVLFEHPVGRAATVSKSSNDRCATFNKIRLRRCNGQLLDGCWWHVLHAWCQRKMLRNPEKCSCQVGRTCHSCPRSAAHVSDTNSILLCFHVFSSIFPLRSLLLQVLRLLRAEMPESFLEWDSADSGDLKMQHAHSNERLWGKSCYARRFLLTMPSRLHWILLPSKVLKD
jgi:hypothetical protein